MGLTILSVGALSAVVSLAAAGRLHLGSRLSAGGSDKQSREEPEKPVAKSAGGRYRIEAEEDARQLLTRIGQPGPAGEPGFLGQPAIQEAWVFKFQGGFLECKLETDFEGKSVNPGVVPDNWPSLLSRDETLTTSTPGPALREGHVILTAIKPTGFDAFAPYFPHLGGLFIAGPAGPLHPLTMLHLEARHRRFYRLFLTAGPFKDARAVRFKVWTELMFVLREPFLARVSAANEFYTGGGQDLTPGRETTILDCPHGFSRLRLKARFLGDGEVAALAKK